MPTTDDQAADEDHRAQGQVGQLPGRLVALLVPGAGEEGGEGGARASPRRTGRAAGSGSGRRRSRRRAPCRRRTWPGTPARAPGRTRASPSPRCRRCRRCAGGRAIVRLGCGRAARGSAGVGGVRGSAIAGGGADSAACVTPRLVGALGHWRGSRRRAAALGVQRAAERPGPLQPRAGRRRTRRRPAPRAAGRGRRRRAAAR